MSKVDLNQKVTLYYTLRNSEGKILEEIPTNEAITYVHGYNQIFPNLEKGLQGHSPGDVIHLEFSSNEAFGEYDETKISLVDRKEFSSINNLAVGMEITALEDNEDFQEKDSSITRDHFWTPQDPSDLFNDEDDEQEEKESELIEEIYVVKEITDLVIVLDANHPYSGMDVIFDVTIVKVEPASVEEIEKLYPERNSDDDLLF